MVESGWFLNGKHTAALEEALRLHCGMPYAVACSNGLDALRLIFRAYIELGVMKPGDEVIVPANTYIASVLAVTDNGLVPVMVEPSEQTMNLDVKRVEAAITPRTRAVMVVHLYGAACWGPELNDLAVRYGLKIVEDNAQAIGAQASCEGLNGGRITGGLGDAAGFSFYPTKNLGALGDAGAVTTSDEQLAKAVKALANYGSDRRYHNIYQGVNCRMDELQAAMLCVKCVISTTLPVSDASVPLPMIRVLPIHWCESRLPMREPCGISMWCAWPSASVSVPICLTMEWKPTSIMPCLLTCSPAIPNMPDCICL